MKEKDWWNEVIPNISNHIFYHSKCNTVLWQEMSYKQWTLLPHLKALTHSMSGRETKILMYTLQIRSRKKKKKIIPLHKSCPLHSSYQKIISHIFRTNLTNITTMAHRLYLPICLRFINMLFKLTRQSCPHN